MLKQLSRSVSVPSEKYIPLGVSTSHFHLGELLSRTSSQLIIIKSTTSHMKEFTSFLYQVAKCMETGYGAREVSAVG